MPAPTLPPVVPTYLGLLAGNRDFRRVWLGQVVSFLGDWFTLLALFEIVRALTPSTVALAGVTVAKTLPVFLVIPIAGPLVDRFDRRKVMLVTDFLRAALALLLVAAHAAGSLEMLFTVVVVQVAVAGVFIPARTAVIPQVTSEAEIPVAMALSAGTWSVMLALGAALGGVATALLGPDGALLLDAATFLVSAAILWGLPPLPPRAAGEPAGSTGFVDGLRHLARRPYLAVVLSLKAMMSIGSGALVMLPLFGGGVFPGTSGPLYVGWLYASRGLGALVGSMAVRRVIGDARSSLRAAIGPGYVLTAVALVAMASAPNVWAACAAVFVAGVGNGIVWVFSGTLAQLTSERAYRGRLFAMEFGCMTLMVSTMSWLSGESVDRGLFTPRDAAATSGYLLLVPAAIWWATLLLFRPGTARPAGQPPVS